MTDTRQRTRRILLVTTGILAVVAIVIPVTGVLVLPGRGGEPPTPTTPTTTRPVVTIKPLPVRPVVNAFVTTPEQCPPPAPTPPDQPIRICDLTKTAVYELQPEALRLELTKVEAFTNPLTGVETVQMTMTDESATKFAEFTATRVGQQVAFVRDTTVVWGPRISAPIEGQVLQLSGELTPEQAAEVAKLLGDQT